MLDFNNDALGLIADALTPLVGEPVTIDGCLPDGTDYMHGDLVSVEATDDGAIIGVRRYDYSIPSPHHGEVVRLHAFQEAHRVRVCR